MIDLGKGTWFSYQKNWLSTQQADSLFSLFIEERNWVQRPIFVWDKPIMQPRLMCWAGMLPYKYSGQTLEPRPLTGSLAQLNRQLSEEWDTPFNHVILNLYRNGEDHVSMHSDNEPELGFQPLIASISLGERRKFIMLPKDKRKRRKHKRSLLLEHGSLLVMGGSFQHKWRHALPKSTSFNGERINITFRYLKGPPGWREVWEKRSPSQEQEE